MLKKLFLLYIFFFNKRIVNTKDIVIGNEPVSRVSYTKFLGVIIDEKLNWSEHVNKNKNKTCQMV